MEFVGDGQEKGTDRGTEIPPVMVSKFRGFSPETF